MVYRLVRLLGVLLILGGCATGSRLAHVADHGEGAAAPGPDLVGTWQGRAWVQAGSINLFSSVPVDLTINPDGTWSWSSKGQVQGRGTVVVRGDRVLLDETWARHGMTEPTNALAQLIELKRSGNELWGVTRAFMPSAESAVQLKKTPS